MRRLAGADAHFLHQETRIQHLHTIKIFVVDPSGSREGFTYARVREQMARIVRHVEAYRWRLIRVPFGLGLPLWADDPTIDLDYHLRRAAVPAPGGPHEFAEVISVIASFPLERDRPLWQLWVVEGLEHGRVAAVMKIHHALADGGSSAQLLAESMRVAGLADAPTLLPDRIPPAARRLADALVVDLRNAARLPRLIARSLRVVLINARRRRAGQPTPPRPYSSPPTRFNRKLTPHRWYASVSVPLADVRLVKDTFGVTINDVLLGLTSSALRAYLLEHGELPDETLTASVPVSVRKPEQVRHYGNRLATWFVRLATDVADPVERLRAVSRSAALARESLETKDRELQHDWQDQWVLWSLYMGRVSALVRRFRKRPLYNVIVSNVRGPSEVLDYDGSRLVGIQSMGPLNGDMGLNVTAWSYVDQLSIGIVACREHVPDIWALADRFAPALAELRDAALRDGKTEPIARAS